MEPQKSIVLPIIVTILISAVLFGGGGYYWAKTTTTAPTPAAIASPTTIVTQVATTATPTPKPSTTPLSATLLYTEVSNTINTATRSYDVVKIYRKSGTAKPELLATVGKAGEFPSSFVLSPDKKTLLINLESKLQALDLTTKSLTTLFTPKKQVFGLVYSPDGSRLFIWDQIYAPSNNDYGYYVHDFNVSSKKDTILAQGTNQDIYFPMAWRSDDTVVLSLPKGESSSLASFSLATKKVTETPGNYSSGTISQTGMRMAVYDKSVEDVCSTFSGTAFSSHKIIDPVSGKEYASVGSSSKMVSVIAFSPDDKNVAYTEQSPRKDQSECDKDQLSTYYQAATESDSTAIAVKDIDTLLNSWKLGENAYASSKDGKAWTISEQGKVTITATSPLRVIATY